MNKRILIVEDDIYKSNQIISFAKSINNNASITTKESLNSSLQEVAKAEYDLIILDMSLPTFENKDNENFQPYGGLLFLDEIKRKKYSFDVVILTQYATFGEGNRETTLMEIDSKCSEKYPNYREIIYFLDESWKEKLKKYITGEKND